MAHPLCTNFEISTTSETKSCKILIKGVLLSTYSFIKMPLCTMKSCNTNITGLAVITYFENVCC